MLEGFGFTHEMIDFLRTRKEKKSSRRWEVKEELQEIVKRTQAFFNCQENDFALQLNPFQGILVADL